MMYNIAMAISIIAIIICLSTVLMLLKIIKMHEDILELIEKENNLIDGKLKEEECEK